MTDKLSFTERQTEHATVVAAAGRIDSSTSSLFEDELARVLDRASSALVIDLTEVEYMSSAGLRVLLMTAKKAKAAGERLILCGLSPHIREVFDVSGFSSIFDIADDAAAAEARAQR